jgi:hypothetical protein
MADNIILEKITFLKLDDDGNPLLNSKGVERVYTLKNFVDCSWICEATDEEHLEEVKEDNGVEFSNDGVSREMLTGKGRHE